MHYFKPAMKVVTSKKFLQNLAAYLILAVFLYILRDFIFVFFLTFIFSFLFFSLWEFLRWKLVYFSNRFRFHPIFEKIFQLNVIITIQYIAFIWILIFTVSDFLPKLVWELSRLPQTFPFMSEQIRTVVEKLNELLTFNIQLEGSISKLISAEDINVIIWVLQNFKNVWTLILQFGLSLILSYIFIMDRERTYTYLDKVKESNFSFLYDAYRVVFEKVLRSFWLLFKAQSIIAFINALMVTLWLSLIWLFYEGGFPYLITLGLLVFIFSFIPVFWTIMSSLPIMLIAFTLWGFVAVIQVIILIAIVNIIEAYYLSPKIVSSLMEMPISITFLVLVISEHLFWVIGLLVGVSMFYFVSELLWDFDKKISKTHRKMKKIKEKEI